MTLRSKQRNSPDSAKNSSISVKFSTIRKTLSCPLQKHSDNNVQSKLNFVFAAFYFALELISHNPRNPMMHVPSITSFQPGNWWKSPPVQYNSNLICWRITHSSQRNEFSSVGHTHCIDTACFIFSQTVGEKLFYHSRPLLLQRRTEG